ncbi:MAG: hypothetical protein V3V10_05300, partial [Planctomycetota bacterium]
MKTFLAAFIVLLAASIFQVSTSAQKAPAKPEFEDAPITDVLVWAQDSIGCGFMYDAIVLTNPATGKITRITASHIQPKTKAEKTLLLFELLRARGLVAFEIGGLPGPTYELIRGKDAARSAPVVTDIRRLEGHYFAALTIRMHRATALEASKRMQRVLTPGASHIEVIENTHTLVVTDFVDRLLQAYEIALAVDVPTSRTSDAVIADFSPRNTVARKLAVAVERLRGEDQEWKVTVNENANILLLSGRRDEIDALLTAMKQIDAFPQKPEYAETTSSIKLFYVTAADAARTLR